LDALVADEHRGPGDELSHLVLALAAEGAVEQLVTLPVVAVFGHCLLWKLFSMRLRRREAGPQTGVLSPVKMQIPGEKSKSAHHQPGAADRRFEAENAPYSFGLLTMTESIRPYSTAASALMKRSRSVSRSMVSRSLPVWAARLPLRRSRSFRISRAWMSISEACPWKPPHGWCTMTRELGRAWRLPAAPPARITAPMLAAWPMHTVLTSGRTNCMVS